MAEDNVREAVRLGLQIKRETEARKAARKQASATIAAPKAAEGLLTNAEEDILKERSRQVAVEGWDAAHDDGHTGGEIARAAAAYCESAARPRVFARKPGAAYAVPLSWPPSWSRDWWKPKSPREDLVRAGALIIAEIERLDRLSTPNLKGGAE